MTWILTNSLWLVGLGLMLASSGIDGAYMARWMPMGWGWLGFVLNTTADVSGMVLTYFFGRLQQDKSRAKRRLAVFLMVAEIVAVIYSWFFGWRQLLIVLPVVEPESYRWVAPIAAGFIPALLAFIGYAEALLAGKFDTSGAPVAEVAGKVARVEKPVAETEAPKSITLSQWRAIAAGLNGETPHDAAGLNQWLHKNGYAKKPETTARRWVEAIQ